MQIPNKLTKLTLIFLGLLSAFVFNPQLQLATDTIEQKLTNIGGYVFSVIGSPLGIARTAKAESISTTPGSRVQTVVASTVYSLPNPASSPTGTQLLGAIGLIEAGPIEHIKTIRKPGCVEAAESKLAIIDSNCTTQIITTFMKVNFNSGADGYVVIDRLAPTQITYTWTEKELLSDLRSADSSGLPITQILSKKVSQQTSAQGFRFIDGVLSFSTSTPAKSFIFDPSTCNSTDACYSVVRELLKAQDVALDLGRCTVPFPESSLYGAHMEEGVISGTLDNNASYFSFNSSATSTSLGLHLGIDLSYSTKLAVDWCSSVPWPKCGGYVKNPACPLPIPYPCPTWSNPFKTCYTNPPCGLPDVCAVPLPGFTMKKEPWSDTSRFHGAGRLAGDVMVSFDSLLVGTDKGTIRLGNNAKVTGTLTQIPNIYVDPVVPNTKLIDVSVPPWKLPPLPKAPITQVLFSQVTVPFTLVQSLHGSTIDKQVNKEFQKLLSEQQTRLNQALTSRPIEFKLPGFNPTSSEGIYLRDWLLERLRNDYGILGDPMVEILNEHLNEVLYYMLTDDKESLKKLFIASEVCPRVISKFKNTGMTSVPIYKKVNNVCVSVNAKTAVSGTSYFSDSICAKPLAFQGDEFGLFCKDTLTTSLPNDRLGNPSAWTTIGIQTDVYSTLDKPSSAWSLAPGAQLGIGVEPIGSQSAPFMKRVNYKTIATNAGSCSLEMRVYKKDINATNLIPLLFIHGGSWSQRGAFLGLEALISSYTDAGFVVFAPFYRLSSNKDGNPECQNAKWTDIVSDAESALSWTKTNSSYFGAPNTGKVAIAGQSAGGHLAAWLVTHKQSDVSRAVLFYPPADFGDFIDRLNKTNGKSFSDLPPKAGTTTPSIYNWTRAKEIFESAFQVPNALTISKTDPIVTANSFGAIVKTGGAANFPQVFIIDGGSDSLLHYSQSQALCEGYGGTVDNNWVTNPNRPRASFSCGSNSFLHIFREANHALEICIAGQACLSGSPTSANKLKDSLLMGRRWLLNPSTKPVIGE